MTVTTFTNYQITQRVCTKETFSVSHTHAHARPYKNNVQTQNIYVIIIIIFIITTIIIATIIII